MTPRRSRRRDRRPVGLGEVDGRARCRGRARPARCSTPARCTGRSRCAALERGVALDDEAACAALARDRDDRGRGRRHDARRPRRERRDPRSRGDGRGVDRRRRTRRCGRSWSRSSGRGSREHGGGVVEGRDIGTVVFPDAPVKVFLTASDDERARRRHARREPRPTAPSPSTTCKAALDRRDAIDSGRAVSPLRAADDALVIDTTDRRRRRRRRRDRRAGPSRGGSR